MKNLRCLMGRVTIMLVSAVCSLASAQNADQDCGGLANHFGPYDYRTATNRALVEDYHFTPKVESLAGGQSTATAGGDLNYTLRVFPNHHRALMSLIRLAEKEKRDPPFEMEYSVGCWFDRAERFRPDDAVVKSLHGMYLTRAGKPKDAVAVLQAALELVGDNANIDYNLGLAYFDLRQFDKSLDSAHRAYARGFPLPGLREKLKRAGKWRDAPPTSGVPEQPATSEPAEAPPPAGGKVTS